MYTIQTAKTLCELKKEIDEAISIHGDAKIQGDLLVMNQNDGDTVLGEINTGE